MSEFHTVAEIREAGGDILQTTDDIAKALEGTKYRILEDRATETMLVVVESEE